MLKNYHEAVLQKPDAAHLRPETELMDATALLIIPDHDLVSRIFWVVSMSNKG